MKTLSSNTRPKVPPETLFLFAFLVEERPASGSGHSDARILPLNAARAHVNAMISLCLPLPWISAVDLHCVFMSDLNWKIYLTRFDFFDLPLSHLEKDFKMFLEHGMTQTHHKQFTNMDQARKSTLVLLPKSLCSPLMCIWLFSLANNT